MNANADDLREDPLVRALRGLPSPPGDPEDARRRRAARAIFVAEGEPTSRARRLVLATTRAATPLVLASIVSVYMIWALSSAMAIVR